MLALGATNTTLALWKFHVDWVTPANSTFTGPTTINVSAYTLPTSEVPQPSPGTPLDNLGDRLMSALQYRNLGGVEALWANHSVVSGGITGVRWYEIRTPNATPTVFQQNTFQPDTTHRWMGSLAVDQSGNMAVGYSVSSSSLMPSIRYAGRLITDTLNTLPQSETTLITGTGVQSEYLGQSLDRWGDYSSMSVDPSDDCTFWYTTEYYEATGFDWQTRIGSFKFPSCGTTPPTPTPTVTGTGSATPSLTSTPTVTGTGPATASLTPSPTATATRTATPSPSPTPMVTATGSATPSLTPSPTATSIVPELHKVHLPLLSMAAPLPPGCTIYSSRDVPKSIPDNLMAGVTSALVIPAPGINIVDLTLRIDDLRHPYDGDLQITLIAPNGTTVLLVDRVGGSGNDFVGTHLNDALSLPLIKGGTAPFTGAFRPDNPLSTFRDIPSADTWTLKISDRAPRDEGALNGWSLQVCDRLPEGTGTTYEGRDH
jgi:subtilisin-like proprotein convertase family protein